MNLDTMTQDDFLRLLKTMAQAQYKMERLKMEILDTGDLPEQFVEPLKGSFNALDSMMTVNMNLVRQLKEIHKAL